MVISPSVAGIHLDPVTFLKDSDVLHSTIDKYNMVKIKFGFLKYLIRKKIKLKSGHV